MVLICARTADDAVPFGSTRDAVLARTGWLAQDASIRDRQ
jgi:hypothetical protein